MLKGKRQNAKPLKQKGDGNCIKSEKTTHSRPPNFTFYPHKPPVLFPLQNFFKERKLMKPTAASVT